MDVYEVAQAGPGPEMDDSENMPSNTTVRRSSFLKWGVEAQAQLAKSFLRKRSSSATTEGSSPQSHTEDDEFPIASRNPYLPVAQSARFNMSLMVYQVLDMSGHNRENGKDKDPAELICNIRSRGQEMRVRMEAPTFHTACLETEVGIDDEVTIEVVIARHRETSLKQKLRSFVSMPSLGAQSQRLCVAAPDPPVREVAAPNAMTAEEFLETYGTPHDVKIAVVAESTILSSNPSNISAETDLELPRPLSMNGSSSIRPLSSEISLNDKVDLNRLDLVRGQTTLTVAGIRCRTDSKGLFTVPLQRVSSESDGPMKATKTNSSAYVAMVSIVSKFVEIKDNLVESIPQDTAFPSLEEPSRDSVVIEPVLKIEPQGPPPFVRTAPTPRLAGWMNIRKTTTSVWSLKYVVVENGVIHVCDNEQERHKEDIYLIQYVRAQELGARITCLPFCFELLPKEHTDGSIGREFRADTREEMCEWLNSLQQGIASVATPAPPSPVPAANVRTCALTHSSEDEDECFYEEVGKLCMSDEDFLALTPRPIGDAA